MGWIKEMAKDQVKDLFFPSTSPKEKQPRETQGLHKV